MQPGNLIVDFFDRVLRARPGKDGELVEGGRSPGNARNCVEPPEPRCGLGGFLEPRPIPHDENLRHQL